MSYVGRFSKGCKTYEARLSKSETQYGQIICINIRPSNVKALSIPIAPMTIWPPPCCFEGELAEIENYTQIRLEFDIPFHAATKNPSHPT